MKLFKKNNGKNEEKMEISLNEIGAKLEKDFANVYQLIYDSENSENDFLIKDYVKEIKKSIKMSLANTEYTLERATLAFATVPLMKARPSVSEEAKKHGIGDMEDVNKMLGESSIRESLEKTLVILEEFKKKAEKHNFAVEKVFSLFRINHLFSVVENDVIVNLDKDLEGVSDILELIDDNNDLLLAEDALSKFTELVGGVYSHRLSEYYLDTRIYADRIYGQDYIDVKEFLAFLDNTENPDVSKKFRRTASEYYRTVSPTSGFVLIYKKGLLEMNEAEVKLFLTTNGVLSSEEVISTKYFKKDDVLPLYNMLLIPLVSEAKAYTVSVKLDETEYELLGVIGQIENGKLKVKAFSSYESELSDTLEKNGISLKDVISQAVNYSVSGYSVVMYGKYSSLVYKEFLKKFRNEDRDFDSILNEIIEIQSVIMDKLTVNYKTAFELFSVDDKTMFSNIFDTFCEFLNIDKNLLDEVNESNIHEYIMDIGKGDKEVTYARLLTIYTYAVVRDYILMNSEKEVIEEV